MAAIYRTLKQLRDEMAVRLGFAAQYGQINAPILNSFLRSGNEQIWSLSAWLHNRKDSENTLAADAQFLAYPAGVEPGFLRSVSSRIAGRWVPLDQGIDDTHRMMNIRSSYPTHFDENAEDAGVVKIEFWPVPTQDADIRLTYDARPGSFINDTDRPAVPDELVFLHALVNAKRHYRQPDADSYAAQLNTLLDEYRARHFGRRVFCAKPHEFDPYDYPPG